MIQLADLPTRRVEAWKYSDLRAAMNGVALDGVRGNVIAPSEGGVIAALAAQAGEIASVRVEAATTIVRVDRTSDAFAPRFLRAHVAEGATFVRIVSQEASDGVVLDGAHVSVAAGGSFRQFVLAEGGKLARIETHVSVEGEGAKIELNAAYLAASGKHADVTSVITHKAPGAQTRQLIKGVAAKGGRGVFQGKIVVECAAQQTDARQYHHGMSLGAGAEIFAKPELLIHADDVQCAHGNTAGGLDETATFYLRSRGIPQKQARAMLIEAFVLGALPEALPAEIDFELRTRIASWLELHA